VRTIVNTVGQTKYAKLIDPIGQRHNRWYRSKVSINLICINPLVDYALTPHPQAVLESNTGSLDEALIVLLVDEYRRCLSISPSQIVAAIKDLITTT